jgi:hypothetical protein
MTTPMPPSAHPDRLALELEGLIQRTLGAVLRDAAAHATDTQPLLVSPAAKSRGPSTLAAAHPGGPSGRAQAQALYQRCLAHYRQAVQPRLRPGLTQDDLGMAAAYFVLSNLGAIDGHEPDAAAMPAVERQLRHLLGGTQAWRGRDLADRQLMFEQLALLGVLINESRIGAARQGEAARANVVQAARGYLKQLLGLDADLLSVSTQGLSTATTLH